MKRVIICTSRNLSKGGSGEYYKVKSIVFAYKNIGYDVRILSTSLFKQNFETIWGCKLIHQKRNLFSFLVKFVKHFPTSIERALFCADVNEIDDNLFFSLVRTVPYCLTRKNVIVDFADILSINFRRIAKSTRGPVSWLKRAESQLLKFDEKAVSENFPVLLVSYSEYLYGLRRNWNCYHLMQPAPISLEAIDFDNQIAHLEKRILFVGPNGYFPNHEALLWVSKCIVSRLPYDWKVVWVGRNDRKAQYIGVEEVGYVDDLPKYMLSSALVLVPIKTSTGIQNKLLDALFLNLNVVTYKKTATLANFRSNPNLIRAKTDEEFIDRIVHYTKSNEPNIKPMSINVDYGLINFQNHLEKISNEYFNS